MSSELWDSLTTADTQQNNYVCFETILAQYIILFLLVAILLSLGMIQTCFRNVSLKQNPQNCHGQITLLCKKKTACLCSLHLHLNCFILYVDCYRNTVEGQSKNRSDKSLNKYFQGLFLLQFFTYKNLSLEWQGLCFDNIFIL